MNHFTETEQKIIECLKQKIITIKQEFHDVLTNLNIDLDNYAIPVILNQKYGFKTKSGYDKSDIPSDVLDALEKSIESCELIHSDKK